MDNILLAQEVIKDSSMKNGSPRCTMKLDIKKAFDSVNWVSVTNVLKAVNFSLLYIDWIQECISTPAFSISLNEKLEGFIQGAKGKAR